MSNTINLLNQAVLHLEQHIHFDYLPTRNEVVPFKKHPIFDKTIENIQSIVRHSLLNELTSVSLAQAEELMRLFKQVKKLLPHHLVTQKALSTLKLEFNQHLDIVVENFALSDFRYNSLITNFSQEHESLNRTNQLFLFYHRALKTPQEKSKLFWHKLFKNASSFSPWQIATLIPLLKYEFITPFKIAAGIHDFRAVSIWGLTFHAQFLNSYDINIDEIYEHLLSNISSLDENELKRLQPFIKPILYDQYLFEIATTFPKDNSCRNHFLSDFPKNLLDFTPRSLYKLYMMWPSTIHDSQSTILFNQFNHLLNTLSHLQPELDHLFIWHNDNTYLKPALKAYILKKVTELSSLEEMLPLLVKNYPVMPEVYQIVKNSIAADEDVVAFIMNLFSTAITFEQSHTLHFSPTGQRSIPYLSKLSLQSGNAKTILDNFLNPFTITLCGKETLKIFLSKRYYLKELKSYLEPWSRPFRESQATNLSIQTESSNVQNILYSIIEEKSFGLEYFIKQLNLEECVELINIMDFYNIEHETLTHLVTLKLFWILVEIQDPEHKQGCLDLIKETLPEEIGNAAVTLSKNSTGFEAGLLSIHAFEHYLETGEIKLARDYPSSDHWRDHVYTDPKVVRIKETLSQYSEGVALDFGKLANSLYDVGLLEFSHTQGTLNLSKLDPAELFMLHTLTPHDPSASSLIETRMRALANDHYFAYYTLLLAILTSQLRFNVRSFFLLTDILLNHRPKTIFEEDIFYRIIAKIAVIKSQYEGEFAHKLNIFLEKATARE